MTKTEQTLKLVKRMGLVRPNELSQHRIPVIYLRRLVQRGQLVQLARGVYAVAGHEPTLHHSLAALDATPQVAPGFADLRADETVAFGFDAQRAVCFRAGGNGR